MSVCDKSTTTVPGGPLPFLPPQAKGLKGRQQIQLTVYKVKIQILDNVLFFALNFKNNVTNRS